MNARTINSFQVMLWREMKISVLSIKRLLQNYGSPLIVVLVFAFVFATNIKYVQFGSTRVSYLQFLIPGVLVLQSYQLFATAFSHARIDKRGMLLTLVITTGTPPSVYLLAKLGAAIGLLSAQTVILGMVGYEITHGGFVTQVLPLALAVLAILSSGVFWFSAGLACGMVVSSETTRDFLFMGLGIPVVFGSSVYYDVHTLPTVLQHVARLNPLEYACTITRHAMLGGANELQSNLAVLLVLAVSSLCLARWCVTRFSC